jgi:hypothetical protein
LGAKEWELSGERGLDGRRGLFLFVKMFQDNPKKERKSFIFYSLNEELVNKNEQTCVLQKKVRFCDLKT